jgi:hypothetical protein
LKLELIIQKLKLGIGFTILKVDRWLNRIANLIGNMGWLSMYGTLSIKHIKANGKVIDYGIVSCKKVTDEFVAYLAGIMVTDATTIGDFKYHISGTGTTAENNDHVELVTPIGTARTVGDQNSSTNTYISVATIAYTDTLAVTEHAIFNTVYTSAQADGTLLDRSLFAAVNVISGDSIQFSYTLTISPEA